MSNLKKKHNDNFPVGLMVSPKLKKLVRYICDRDYRFIKATGFGKYDHVPDEEFLKMKYKAFFLFYL